MMPNSNSVQEAYENAPLMQFSPYTHGQICVVTEVGQEIITLLDECFLEEGIDSVKFLKAYDRFWLWVIASYEVSRTMCQKKKCFSARFSEQICLFKNEVSALRMPFAKQEFKGRNEPIFGEASVRGLDAAERDMRFEVDGAVIFARPLINRFESLINSVTPSDVVESIYGQSYSRES